jgi:hypothetical protein
VKSQRAHFDEVRAGCEQVSVDMLRRRPAFKRFLDSVLWLFSPYL